MAMNIYRIGRTGLHGRGPVALGNTMALLHLPVLDREDRRRPLPPTLQVRALGPPAPPLLNDNAIAEPLPSPQLPLLAAAPDSSVAILPCPRVSHFCPPRVARESKVTAVRQFSDIRRRFTLIPRVLYNQLVTGGIMVAIGAYGSKILVNAWESHSAARAAEREQEERDNPPPKEEESPGGAADGNADRKNGAGGSGGGSGGDEAKANAEPEKPFDLDAWLNETVQKIQNFKFKAPTAESMSAMRYYTGGFEEKMTRREAAQILGIRWVFLGKKACTRSAIAVFNAAAPALVAPEARSPLGSRALLFCLPCLSLAGRSRLSSWCRSTNTKQRVCGREPHQDGAPEDPHREPPGQRRLAVHGREDQRG